MMKRLYALLAALVLLMTCGISAAHAETKDENGLKATLTVTQDDFALGEAIPVTLELENTSNDPIQNIAVTCVSPQGYSIAGQAVQFDSLGVGKKSVQRLTLEQASLPQTGDSTPLWGAALGGLASMGALVALILGGKKLGKRFLSLLLCVAMLGSLGQGFVPAARAESVPAAGYAEHVMLLEEPIKINGKAMAVQLRITYSSMASQGAYTRAEWIATLLDDIGTQIQSQNSGSYADIAGTRYRQQIETAVELGILTPSSASDCFFPNSPATRDFAAATTVRGLRFLSSAQNPLNTPDANLSDYRPEAAIAVHLGMLSLENGLYMPKRPLNDAEASSIRKVIREVQQSTVITEDGGAGITYVDGVLQVTTNDYTDENGVLTLPASVLPAEARVGSILVLNGNKAYRILSMQRTGGRVIIQYAEPELRDVVREIEAYGFLRGNASDFIPAEGVEMTVVGDNASRGNSAARLGNDSGGLLGSIKLTGEVNIPKKSSSGSNSNPLKFKYEVNVSIPESTFKFDANLWTMDFKNVHVSISPKITAKYSLGTSNDHYWDNTFTHSTTIPEPERRFLAEAKIPLGKIPLFGIYGAGVLVEFYIKMTTEGYITIESAYDSIMGIHIYNNVPRELGKSSLNIHPQISGQVTVGPEFYLVGNLIGQRLLAFGGYFAGYVEGTINLHRRTICIDGKIGALLEIEVGDSLVKKWLGKSFTLKWEVLKHAFFSTPHIEIDQNGIHPLDHCTMNLAWLQGIVALATNRTRFIQGANVVLTSANGNRITATSDATGAYTVSLTEGDYVLRVNKEGYIPFEMNITVLAGEPNVVETLLMVAGSEGDTRTGTIGGIITNAKTGDPISGVTIGIRKGWNKLTGPMMQTVHTNGNGQYEATLPLGNYTLVLEKAGFISSSFNVAVSYNTDRSHHGNMLPSPFGNDQSQNNRMSVVLTWGEHPRDLDSHMRGYSASGNEVFHTYYRNLSYTVNSGKQTFLDLDDTTSYGPETTTVMGMQSGEKYSFFVHDFTNRRSTSSVAMANSGAKVEVYVGTQLVRTFNIPAKAGTVWHVFDYDVATNSVTPVNTFSYTGDASAVGARANGELTGRMALRTNVISPDKE